jgi:hypothetical protein
MRNDIDIHGRTAPHPDTLTYNAAEDDYWRTIYADEPYYDRSFGFEDYVPAYRMGFEGRGRFSGQRFEEVAASLREDWENQRGVSKLDWEQAMPAARAAWTRRERAYRDPG